MGAVSYTHLNVVALHKFLYGDEAYVPSSTVQDISAKIAEIVSGLGALEDTQVITPETEKMCIRDRHRTVLTTPLYQVYCTV